MQTIRFTFYKSTGKYYTHHDVGVDDLPKAPNLMSDHELMDFMRENKIGVTHHGNFLVTLTEPTPEEIVPQLINGEAWHRSKIIKIGMWAEQQFRQSTPRSIINHLKEEFEELSDDPSDVEEMADMVMLIYHLAYKQGLDLVTAIEKKFRINQERKWGPVDERGVSNHI